MTEQREAYVEKVKKVGERFDDLIATMARLRGEQGCLWDKEQTHITLKSFLLEETYELLDAIEQGSHKELVEELGDVLLQIIFHCQIASEEGQFTVAEVISRLIEKMERRHPHVFSDHRLPDSDAVLKHWTKAKAEENNSENSASALGNIPRAMPALARAQTVTKRASLLGFDWTDVEPVWGKLEEELTELKAAVTSGDKGRTSEEMGDVLLSLVNLCRFIDIKAEDALTHTVDRFLKRFAHIERRIREKEKTLAESSLDEMDALWEEAKKIERRQTSNK